MNQYKLRLSKRDYLHEISADLVTYILDNNSTLHSRGRAEKRLHERGQSLLWGEGIIPVEVHF